MSSQKQRGTMKREGVKDNSHNTSKRKTYRNVKWMKDRSIDVEIRFDNNRDLMEFREDGDLLRWFR